MLANGQLKNWFPGLRYLGRFYKGRTEPGLACHSHQQAFPGRAPGQPWTCTVAPHGCNSGQRGNSISSPTRCLWVAASARDLLADPLTFASTCYGRGLPHVSHLVTLTTHTAFGPRGVNCCIHFWASWLIIRCS